MESVIYILQSKISKLEINYSEQFQFVELNKKNNESQSQSNVVGFLLPIYSDKAERSR